MDIKNLDRAVLAQLRQVLRGVKVEAGIQGKPPRSCLPILLLQFLEDSREFGLGGNLPLEVCCYGLRMSTTIFFTFCRTGEMTVENEKSYDPSSNLSHEDLAVDNAACPQAVSIEIKRSKTD